MESFFSTVKSELADRFDTYGDAKMELFDYIEVFYNQRRRHSTLGQISPAAFERRANEEGVSGFPPPSGGFTPPLCGLFLLRRSQDKLLETFRRVSEELHKQYVIAFEPTARDGETHEIDIEIMREDMTARARRSYVATVEGQ